MGTSSIRRQVQLQAQRPDLTFKPLQGNIDTHIRSWKKVGDAIVLAMASVLNAWAGWTKADFTFRL